jgi:hypothetical protein
MTNAGEKINFMRTDTKRKVVLDMEIIVVLTYNSSKLLVGILILLNFVLNVMKLMAGN